MTNIQAIGATGSRGTASAKKSTPQRNATYTVKSGDNLTQIGKKFGMTANEFKAWTGLKSDSLQPNQKINLPQSKVPESKGIMSLANKYNMDFEAFCRLNNIPKPYKEYVAGKDEQFYVCKDFGKNKTNGSGGSTPAQGTSPQKTPQGGNDKNTIKDADNVIRQKNIMPSCGYNTVKANETLSVSHPGGSYPAVPVDSKGNVVAEVIKFEPSKKGKLTGKTIMVNAGHGWGYYNGKPKFDIGTNAKDANKKTIEEWNKNRNYADNLIESLRAEGATVIYTTGKAIQVCEAKRKYGADLLISIHCNAVDRKDANGLAVIYPKKGAVTESKKLAEKINANFKTNVNQHTDVMDDTEGAHNSLGILRSASKNDTYIPSVMVEMGFMSNAYDIANIDSKTQRQKAMNQVTQAVVDYLNPPKPQKK